MEPIHRFALMKAEIRHGRLFCTFFGISLDFIPKIDILKISTRFKGRGVQLPRYPVTVNGLDRTGLWAPGSPGRLYRHWLNAGKADGREYPKPGNFSAVPRRRWRGPQFFTASMEGS
jgi:hypothetical protein